MLPLYCFFKKKIKILGGVILLWGMTSFILFAQVETVPKVKIPGTKASTNELIKLLEAESGWVISYSSRLCVNESIAPLPGFHSLIDHLNKIFLNCPFDYELRGKRIIIKPAVKSEAFFVVSGFVLDEESGESLPSAGIFLPKSTVGTVCNNYGYYSISLPQGEWQLRASYVGYQVRDKVFNLRGDTVINFNLNSAIQLKEIAVLGHFNPDLINAVRMGAVVLSVEEIRSTPALLGETDLIKNIQMLPGVQGGSEGFSGLYVRGGGPDQNLILLDDVPVYNVGHLLGFFSIFNADAVKHVSVLKGGFPARYGGRLSSVVDVRMVEGNREKTKGTINLGLLSSGISLNGPVKKDKSGYALSFRRTYLDAIAGLAQRGKDETANYYFFDLNGKFNHTFNPKNRIYLSSYFGRDKYFTAYNFINVPDVVLSSPSTRLNDENSAGWGNFVSALRWNHLFNNKLFSNITATYSNYRFFIGVKRNNQVNNTWDSFEQNYVSGIQDFSIRADFDYYPSNGNIVKFGGNVIYHLFNPGIDIIQRSVNTSAPVDTTIGNIGLEGWEHHLFYENEFTSGDNFRINLGGRLILFKGQDKVYWSAEPRVSVHYSLLPNLALRTAFSSMSQFIHMVSSSNVALPTDLWLPVTDKIPPMRALQVSLGSDLNIDSGEIYTLSFDLYKKWLDNILHYRESTGFFDYSSNWEDKLTGGEGTSYGLELLFRKNKGKLTGWLGYTLARTFNRFEEINNGKEFAARFDRRHDIGLSVNYGFNSRLDGGLMWQYGSGTPITLPSEKYFAPDLPFIGSTNNQGYSENAISINGFRMPAFHRLDVGLNFKKEFSKGEQTWSVGIINLYGRQNPFLLYFAQKNGSGPGTAHRQLKQLSIFPFPIPYIKYSFKF